MDGVSKISSAANTWITESLTTNPPGARRGSVLNVPAMYHSTDELNATHITTSTSTELFGALPQIAAESPISLSTQSALIASLSSFVESISDTVSKWCEGIAVFLGLSSETDVSCEVNLNTQASEDAEPVTIINSDSATDDILRWRSIIDASANRHGIEPEILAAIISRESNGRNLVGDDGHGRGLMQIDDRWHRDFLDAHGGGLDPMSNVDYGAKLLRSNIDHFDGDVRAGVAAFNAGAAAVRRALGQGDDVDRFTTGGDYSSDVLMRAEALKERFAH